MSTEHRPDCPRHPATPWRGLLPPLYLPSDCEGCAADRDKYLEWQAFGRFALLVRGQHKPDDPAQGRGEGNGWAVPRSLRHRR